MADKKTESTMKDFMTNDHEDYYSGITCITVNGKNAYELKGKFLNDLHNNAFDGTNGKDAVKHIEYFLIIIDPIDLPNVNHDKLRVVVFPISLVGGARRWFDKIKESIDSWVDLTAKFFRKYYPPSRTSKTNSQMIRWDPTNPKFENWLASKFVNCKTLDIFTKGSLWDYWKMGCDEIEPTDDESFNLEETDHDDEQEIDVPWLDERPWTDTGVWKELKPVKHTCKPFNYKTGCSEWPICGWRNDEFYNGGNLLRAYIIRNILRYQDFEWYDSLKDSELKEQALRNKAIMDGLIDDDNDDESRYEYHEADEREELCEIHELPVCTIRRFEMIKYSFGQDEEYVAVKEDKYDDLTRANENACRAPRYFSKKGQRMEGDAHQIMVKRS
ncbi:hypothetical protein Tco_1452966 [Tanacetum coccineum]